MSYQSWLQAHGEKHKAVLEKLAHLSHEEIIDFILFKNLLV